MKNYLSGPWPALILITLLAAIIYSNIYHCPFVFDDIHSIVENQAIRDVSNFLDLKQLLKPRSVVDLTFALNYKFGKLDVSGYHLVNVLIHIINGFLVYFLALTIFEQILSGSAQRFDESSKLKAERGKVKGQRSKDNPKHRTSNIPLSDGSVAYTGFQSTINNQQSTINLMSLFAALIFVAHPIQTQAVTYTVQRYASLAAMFYMGSVLFYLKARMFQQRAKSKEQRVKSRGQGAGGKEQRPEVGGPFSFQLSAYFALSIICGLLAFLSKQNTASLPAAIILVEYLFIDRTWRGWKKKILWFTPSFILFVTLVLYVSGFFSGAVQGRGLLEDVSDLMRETGLVSRWSYLCTQFNVLVIYIRLLFLPIGQNLDYLYPFKSGFFDAYTPLAFLFLTGLAVLGIWKRKRQSIITLAIFWFFITLSVESSIIPIKDALFEHRLYLPMFGFAIVVSWLVFHFLSKRRSWAIVISVIIIVSLGSATFLRNRTWQEPVTLWTDVAAKAPHNPTAYNNLGNAFGNEGKFEEAIKHFSEALRLKPDYAKTHYNMGIALARQGRLDYAIKYFSQAIWLKPRYTEAYYNMGITLARQGRLEEAVNHFSKAIHLKPGYAEAHNNLGGVLVRQGRLEEAANHLSKAIHLKPDYAEAHNNLGGVLVRQGRLQEATDHFTKALRVKPHYMKAHYNLAVVLEQEGRLDDAKNHFVEALRLKPDFGAIICYEIASICARQKKIEESIEWLSRAIQKGFRDWERLRNDRNFASIRESLSENLHLKKLINSKM